MPAGEPSVARRQSTIVSGGTCRALGRLIAHRSITAQARFAAQVLVFTLLSLRAALNYVRHSAALRSYSAFVEMADYEELSNLCLSNERSS